MPPHATAIGHHELRFVAQQVAHVFFASEVWQRRVEDVQDKPTSVDELFVDASQARARASPGRRRASWTKNPGRQFRPPRAPWESKPVPCLTRSPELDLLPRSPAPQRRPRPAVYGRGQRSRRTRQRRNILHNRQIYTLNAPSDLCREEICGPCALRPATARIVSPVGGYFWCGVPCGYSHRIPACRRRNLNLMFKLSSFAWYRSADIEE
jgi:hypothetical protein